MEGAFDVPERVGTLRGSHLGWVWGFEGVLPTVCFCRNLMTGGRHTNLLAGEWMEVSSCQCQGVFGFILQLPTSCSLNMGR